MNTDFFKETMEIVDEFSTLDGHEAYSAQLIYLKEKFYPQISEHIMSFVKGSEKVRVILDCDPTKKAMLLQVKRFHEKAGASKAPRLKRCWEELKQDPTIILPWVSLATSLMVLAGSICVLILVLRK